jgi:hypothetical protein
MIYKCRCRVVKFQTAKSINVKGRVELKAAAAMEET